MSAYADGEMYVIVKRLEKKLKKVPEFELFVETDDGDLVPVSGFSDRLIVEFDE